MPRSVRYSILPLGGEEFYGATNELRFEVGETSKTANVLARGDGVPEVRWGLKWVFNVAVVGFGWRKVEFFMGLVGILVGI